MGDNNNKGIKNKRSKSEYTWLPGESKKNIEAFPVPTSNTEETEKVLKSLEPIDLRLKYLAYKGDSKGNAVAFWSTKDKNGQDGQCRLLSEKYFKYFYGDIIEDQLGNQPLTLPQNGIHDMGEGKYGYFDHRVVLFCEKEKEKAKKKRPLEITSTSQPAKKKKEADGTPKPITPTSKSPKKKSAVTTDDVKPTQRFIGAIDKRNWDENKDKLKKMNFGKNGTFGIQDIVENVHKNMFGNNKLVVVVANEKNISHLQLDDDKIAPQLKTTSQTPNIQTSTSPSLKQTTITASFSPRQQSTEPEVVTVKENGGGKNFNRKEKKQKKEKKEKHKPKESGSYSLIGEVTEERLQDAQKVIEEYLPRYIPCIGHPVWTALDQDRIFAERDPNLIANIRKIQNEQISRLKTLDAICKMDPEHLQIIHALFDCLFEDCHEDIKRGYLGKKSVRIPSYYFPEEQYTYIRAEFGFEMHAVYRTININKNKEKFDNTRIYIERGNVIEEREGVIQTLMTAFLLKDVPDQKFVDAVNTIADTELANPPELIEKNRDWILALFDYIFPCDRVPLDFRIEKCPGNFKDWKAKQSQQSQQIVC